MTQYVLSAHYMLGKKEEAEKEPGREKNNGDIGELRARRSRKGNQGEEERKEAREESRVNALEKSQLHP